MEHFRRRLRIVLEPGLVPQVRSVHPVLRVRRHRVVEQLPVLAGTVGRERHSQDPVHQVEGLVLDVVGSPVRIGVHRFVGGLPGRLPPRVVDDDREGLAVGDVDEGVPALVARVSHVHGCRDEDGTRFELTRWDLVAVQDLVLWIRIGCERCILVVQGKF